jgi:hypothetical protein
MKTVFLVLKVLPLQFGHDVVGCYETEQDAEAYCKQQNDLSHPIFDDYGLIEGEYYCVSVQYVKPRNGEKYDQK